ncbi:unnamed protein product [Scytosiphon promiscuus]
MTLLLTPPVPAVFARLDLRVLLKMGSYLSVHNNTNDVWFVKVGSDTAASEVATYAGVVAVVVGTAGLVAAAAAPFLAAGAYFGISAGAAASIMTASAAVTTASVAGLTAGTWAAAVGKIVTETWQDDGFVRVDPGTKHRWGKMTLSLWQQAECRRFQDIGAGRCKVAKLFMRPIFSHSLANKDYVYYIQTWLNKPGVNFKEMEITR